MLEVVSPKFQFHDIIFPLGTELSVKRTESIKHCAVVEKSAAGKGLTVTPEEMESLHPELEVTTSVIV